MVSICMRVRVWFGGLAVSILLCFMFSVLVIFWLVIVFGSFFFLRGFLGGLYIFVVFS